MWGEFVMYDYDSVKYIEVLNKYLGMEHRTESFNLSKTDDLKQALTLAVGAYRDYFNYESKLYELVEHFDESLEHYDTVTWVNMGHSPKKTDSLAMECAACLSDANDSFRELTERAEEYLSVLLKIILTAPDTVQQEILGGAYCISPQEIEERLQDLFTGVCYSDYHYAIPDNLNAFLETLKEEWSELALP